MKMGIDEDGYREGSGWGGGGGNALVCLSKCLSARGKNGGS